MEENGRGDRVRAERCGRSEMMSGFYIKKVVGEFEVQYSSSNELITHGG